MAHRIVHRLGGETVRGNLSGRLEAWQGRGGDQHDLGVALLTERGGLPFDGADKPEFVESGRPKFLDHAAHFAHRFPYRGLHRVDHLGRLFSAGRKGAADGIER